MTIQPRKFIPQAVSLDLSYLRQISEGDISFEREILLIYLREVPLLAQKTKKTLKVGDYKTAADLIHKLKSKIRVIGLKQAWRLADFIEASLRKKTNLSELVKKIKVFFKIILHSVQLAKKELLKRTRTK
ncbi:MAG: hypothetical protein ACPG49_00270 [Chitinophagales bacterium]